MKWALAFATARVLAEKNEVFRGVLNQPIV